MKKVLVLQNGETEGPARLGEVLGGHGFELHTIYCPDDPPLPESPGGYSAVVVMGGPQAVYEAAPGSYLDREIRLTAETVRRGVPFFGICLGGQILAAALGARVEKGEREAAWHEIELTSAAAADPLFEGQPVRAQALHFHGDRFAVPEGAVSLCSSAHTPCQAFRAEEGIYGFQFHPEVDRALLETWARTDARYLIESGESPEKMMADTDVYLADYEHRMRGIFECWAAMLA